MSESKALKSLIEKVQFRIAAIIKTQVIGLDGSISFEKTDVFEPDEIKQALELSLSAFNMIPNITYFKFTDEENIDQISDLLVTYAAHLLLIRQALVEKGREYSISDNGIEYAGPNIGQFMLTVSDNLYQYWYGRVQVLKGDSHFYEDFVKDPDEE